MKWEVELQGSRDCLRDILENFSSYDSERYRCGFSVGMEEGQVLLKADRFETCTDVASVRDAAIRLLYAMNGILKAQAPCRPNDGVKVGTIYRELTMACASPSANPTEWICHRRNRARL